MPLLFITSLAMCPGGDPKTDMAERKAAQRIATFGQIADEYISTMQSKWRGAGTVAAWERFARTYAKAIANVPVDKISTDDVVRVLRALWQTKPETAAKVRERIKLVLDHARARGLRSADNAAQWKGHLDQILPPPKKLANGHLAALPFAEVPRFLQQLRAVDGIPARALEFLVLTAVRSGEARGAVWSEFDLKEALWTIPASRMKSGRPHRVPLSGRAIAIVKEMQARSVGAYVFPSQRGGRPLPGTTLARTLSAAAGPTVTVTVHGFRSCFRDWVAEATNFQSEIAEAALAHAVGDAVERAYRRGDALQKRRQLMEAWSNYCGDQKGDNVFDLRSGGHGN